MTQNQWRPMYTAFMWLMVLAVSLAKECPFGSNTGSPCLPSSPCSTAGWDSAACIMAIQNFCCDGNNEAIGANDGDIKVCRYYCYGKSKLLRAPLVGLRTLNLGNHNGGLDPVNNGTETNTTTTASTTTTSTTTSTTTVPPPTSTNTTSTSKFHILSYSYPHGVRAETLI
jgi:hypothetical protein